MKHVNVALFVPDEGCPHQCVFCSQKTISGKAKRLSAADVSSAVEIALKSGSIDPAESEIAFFGGSFTGIDRAHMDELLEAANEYVKKGFFKGIRVSTRPDYIDDEVLIHLKQFGVSAIEIGCQSMDDEVLRLNGRGHSSDDIVKAARLVKAFGFELGVQMMTGLLGDTNEKALETAERLIALSPDTVRIYPTVVLEGTALAGLFRAGAYKPQSLDEAVELCSELMLLFEKEGVKVIRVGLHSGGNVEEGFLAGAFHPAFAELCRSGIFLKKILSALSEARIDGGRIKLEVNPRFISQAVGQKKSNLARLERMGCYVTVSGNENLKEYEVRVASEG